MVCAYLQQLNVVTDDHEEQITALLQVCKTMDRMGNLEKDLATCHFRNCRLSSDLDSARVQSRVLEVVNGQLARQLAASKMAYDQHPALNKLQKEAEYRKAVEAALHASTTELDKFQKAYFDIHVGSLSRAERLRSNRGCGEKALQNIGTRKGGRCSSLSATFHSFHHQDVPTIQTIMKQRMQVTLYHVSCVSTI